MLGISHRTRKKASNKLPAERRFRIEPLEERQVLSATFGSAFTLESLGDVGFSTGYGVHHDSAGNTIVLGRFQGTIDADPGPGVHLLSTPLGSNGAPIGNIFVAKYDSTGQLAWANTMGGQVGQFGPDLAVSADGSTYVVGTFTGTAEFGNTTLTSPGGDAVFLTKIDASGSFSWSQQFAGTSGNSVTVDATGNVILAGEINGRDDAFLTKLDSDGNQVWSRVFGASSSISSGKGKNSGSPTGWARVYEVTTDASGAIYATGKMSGTVDFDPSSAIVSGSGTGFVLKVNSNGSASWVKTFSGGGVESHGIEIDAQGNIYTAGIFVFSTTFGYATQPASGKKPPQQTAVTLNSGNGSAAYVTKMNSAGDLMWARQTLGNGSEAANNLVLDLSGNVYVAGYFTDTTDFDPGSGAFNLTSNGNRDAFVWKLDTNGDFAWVASAGGTSQESAPGLAIDSAGSVYISGGFRGVVDFDPASGSEYLLASTGISATTTAPSIYVWKLDQPASPLAMVAFALTVDGQATPVTEGGTHARMSPTPSAAAKPAVITLPAAAAHSAAAGVLADRVLAQAANDLSWLEELWQGELSSEGMAV